MHRRLRLGVWLRKYRHYRKALGLPRRLAAEKARWHADRGRRRASVWMGLAGWNLRIAMRIAQAVARKEFSSDLDTGRG